MGSYKIKRRDFLNRMAILGVSGGSLATYILNSSPAVAEALAGKSNDLLQTRTTLDLTKDDSTQDSNNESPQNGFIGDKRTKIGHLLRRAGFGANPEEIEQYLKMGLQATVNYLIDYEKTDNDSLELRLADLGLDIENNKTDLQRWWLLRMIYTKRPFQEKMVLFWHGLLTSASSKVGRGSKMLHQNVLFRTHALGHFNELLKAISRDPAMLIWLDSKRNRKRAPNENFARELLELFSMGEGTFTETDVREVARAFTGYSISNDAFSFRASQHDDGEKRFFNRTGKFDGDDIIDIIMEQPITAEYISKRLFTFFVHENPPPAFIKKMGRILRANQYKIQPVMRFLLSSREFYSKKAYRAKIKSPSELVVGTLRMLEIETDGRKLPNVLTSMGQTLFNPPDVAGWPGGHAWINSTTLLHRLNFAHLITRSRIGGTRFEPRRVLPNGNGSEIQLTLNTLVNGLLDGRMDPRGREILEAHGRFLNSQTSTSGRPSKIVDRSQRDLAYYMLASPEFQLG